MLLNDLWKIKLSLRDNGSEAVETRSVHEMASPLKRLLNPESCVDDCLRGLAAVHSDSLQLFANHRVLLDRNEPGESTVALVSGGGSGHEPFAAGYVGKGMLTAAVCGSVFASPPAQHIRFAIRKAAHTRGPNGSVLVLTPNYTGDVLNFGLAVELARSEGLRVEQVVIGEDIAVDAYAAGRRGMTGLIAVFKIAGHLAACGAPLEQVAETARRVLSQMGSLGLALTPCTLPGASSPLFQVDVNEAVLGVGVHGEAGIERIAMPTAETAARLLVDRLFNALQLKQKQVVVLVNNLGALLGLELWTVVAEVVERLHQLQVEVLRVFVAPFFTSLDMSGLQVCCVVLSDGWLPAFNGETNAPAWPGKQLTTCCVAADINDDDDDDSNDVVMIKGPRLGEKDAGKLKRIINKIADALISVEDTLNLLDSGCGDGDCGSTLKRLACELKREKLIYEHPATLSGQLAQCAASAMGGTSGAIYSLLFTNISTSLEAISSDFINQQEIWATIWRSAIQGVQVYSRARVGDRTMFDALEPACDAFKNSINNQSTTKEALQAAFVAAERGCKATKTMQARAGRAGYVNQSELNDVDAGAFAVTVWLKAIADSF